MGVGIAWPQKVRQQRGRCGPLGPLTQLTRLVLPGRLQKFVSASVSLVRIGQAIKPREPLPEELEAVEKALTEVKRRQKQARPLAHREPSHPVLCSCGHHVQLKAQQAQAMLAAAAPPPPTFSLSTPHRDPSLGPLLFRSH
jgi:hypothetical protein